MTMIQTHEQIDGGEEYLGWARQKLAALERSRQAVGVPELSQTLNPDDSVEVYISASGTGHLIRISAIGSCFICHPRDNTNPGGAKPGGVAISPTTYQYPLVDDDQGSRVLTWEGDGWLVSSEVENYGNLEWIGPGGEVVSWRGPGGRQFAMDRLLSFPGFTEWDGADAYHDYYTPYRNQVYQGGEVSKEFPVGHKVLGAALAGGSLVCVVAVDYAGIENPDGGTGGFYDEVYVGDVRIGWQAASRPSVPWFFDSTGRVAVCGNRKLTIAEDLASVTFEPLSSGSGTETNLYNGSNQWGFDKSGSWPVFRDFVAESLRELTLSLAFSESTSLSSSYTDLYDDLDEMVTVVNPPGVSGPEEASVGASYSAINAGPNIEWSFSGGSISNSGTILSMSGCGVQTVSWADSCGRTGSMQVRAAGVWVEVSNQSWQPWTCGSPCYAEAISGGTKTWYAIMCCEKGEAAVPYGGEILSNPGGSGCNHMFSPSGCPSAPSRSTYIVHRIVYNWVCP